MNHLEERLVYYYFVLGIWDACYFDRNYLYFPFYKSSSHADICPNYYHK